MTNILFFGTYQHKVDSKGRVSIPAEWRRHLRTYQQSLGMPLIKREKTVNTKLFFTAEYSSTEKLILKATIKIHDLLKRGDYGFDGIKQYNLDTEGRTVFKQEKGKTAILKGCGDYFTIEFRLDN